MGGICYACAKPAERACTHCGRLFCLDHGKVGVTQVAVCGACLAEQKRVWPIMIAVVVAWFLLWLLYRAVR